MPDLAAQAIENAANKYYGKYKGVVVDNQDPENLGRVRVRVPSVLGAAVTRWALPVVPYGGLGDQGMFFVPDSGARVWVEFVEGEIDEPIWTGCFWTATGAPPAEASVSPPTTRMIKTAAGNRLQIDDASGAEKITIHHPSAAEFMIDQNGAISLTDKVGATVRLDASDNSITVEDTSGNTMVMNSTGTTITDSSGNKIEMTASGINVKGATITIEGSQVALGSAGGEPLIKGSTFLSLFATHVHTTTAPGAPTSPPIPQGEMSSLSSKVTAS